MLKFCFYYALEYREKITFLHCSIFKVHLEENYCVFLKVTVILLGKLIFDMFEIIFQTVVILFNSFVNFLRFPAPSDIILTPRIDFF